MLCGVCGAPVYSCCQRRDYYVCRDRRLKPSDGVRCTSKFMRRERLDPALDSLFGDRLTDPGFLEKIAEGVSAGSRTQSRCAHLTADMQALEKKRQRILDSYFEGVIDQDERDRRLGAIEHDRALYGDLLMREGMERPGLSVHSLAQAFAPFQEWKFLSRKHKRRLLTALVPEIYVNDYRVLGVTLLSDGDRCNENTRSPADISTTLRMNVFARLP
ncbi:MAG: zinc ribbon domain-containing protein [Acidobacteria bacterium]|nr:zinc ribbon domain-containing protein [Acidobacteriota bacterium]